MTGEILEKLQQITPEEQRILSGEKTIEKEIYMEENSNVIGCHKAFGGRKTHSGADTYEIYSFSGTYP